MGFDQNPGNLPLAAEPIIQPQLWEAIVERLRRDILSGAIPEGTKLVEADLAARFGVSRGPVNQAVRELIRLGLAIDLPRRGRYVATQSESDLSEILVVREVIEIAAARLAMARARDEELAMLGDSLGAIEAAYDAGDKLRAQSLDVGLHRGLVELSGSARLLSLFEEYAGQTLLVLNRIQDEEVGLTWAPPRQLHRDIVDALIRRDQRAATAALSAHFYHGASWIPGLDGEAPDQSGAGKPAAPESRRRQRGGSRS